MIETIYVVWLVFCLWAGKADSRNLVPVAILIFVSPAFFASHSNLPEKKGAE
jgi:hypothetical protein